MNLKIFFDNVRPMFGGSLSSSQVAHLSLILDTLYDRKVSLKHAAYIFATAHHETGRFEYLREIWGPTETQLRYEGRKDLGNTKRGDGKRFMGRGYVHVTGRANYSYWSKRLGVDLIGSPERASEPDIAAKIMVDGMLEGTFTTHKLSDFSSYKAMRRVVNGTDKASTIAGYAVDYEDALRRSNYGLTWASPITPPPAPAPVPEAPVAPPEPKPAGPKKSSPGYNPTTKPERSIWESIVEFLMKLFGGRK